MTYLGNKIIDNYYFRIGARGDVFNVRSRLSDHNIHNIEHNQSFIEALKT